MKNLSATIGALFLGATLAISLGALGQSSSGVSGLPSAPTFAGTVTFKSSAVSTKACASGYVRKAPNFCWKGINSVNTALTALSCTDIGTPSADATALLLDVQLNVNTANAIALRSSVVSAFTTSACTGGTIQASLGLNAREEVATAAGTNLNTVRGQLLIGTLTNMRIMFTRDAGVQGAAWYEITGYYD